MSEPRCPKCGSKHLAVERRPDGNANCQNCNWQGPYKDCFGDTSSKPVAEMQELRHEPMVYKVEHCGEIYECIEKSAYDAVAKENAELKASYYDGVKSVASLQAELAELYVNLLATIAQWTATPEKGYRAEPFMIASDINRIGCERDAARAEVERMRKIADERHEHTTELTNRIIYLERQCEWERVNKEANDGGMKVVMRRNERLLAALAEIEKLERGDG